MKEHFSKTADMALVYTHGLMAPHTLEHFTWIEKKDMDVLNFQMETNLR